MDNTKDEIRAWSQSDYTHIPTTYTQVATVSHGKSFLDLPAEMRNEVYEYVLVSPDSRFLMPTSLWRYGDGASQVAFDVQWKPVGDTPFDGVSVSQYVRLHSQRGKEEQVNLNLLRTSRQVYHEAAPVFYGRNKFVITASHVESHKLFDAPPATLANLPICHITDLSFVIDLVPHVPPPPARDTPPAEFFRLRSEMIANIGRPHECWSRWLALHSVGGDGGSGSGSDGSFLSALPLLKKLRFNIYLQKTHFLTEELVVVRNAVEWLRCQQLHGAKVEFGARSLEDQRGLGLKNLHRVVNWYLVPREMLREARRRNREQRRAVREQEKREKKTKEEKRMKEEKKMEEEVKKEDGEE